MPLGILSGLMKTGMESGLAKEARRENNQYWNENQDKLFMQQQKAEQLTVRNRAEALRMAGLNPSLAGQASAMAVGSAPQQNIQAHAEFGFDSKFGELALMAAQKDLLEQQAREKKIDNDRKEHEDSSSGQSMKSYANYVLNDPNIELNDEQKAYWTLISERPEASFNVGDINAEMKFRDLISKNVDTTANAYAKAYSNYMYQAYLKGDMAGLDLKLKKNEVRQLWNRIGEIQANMALLKEKKDLTQKEKDEITARTNKAILEAQKIYHDDLVALFRDEQWQALGVKAAEKAIDDLPQIIDMFKRAKRKQTSSSKFPNSD